MKPIEIVELVKQSNPKLLGKMPEAKAAKLIAAALKQISKQLEATDEGQLKVGPLGVFGIRKVEREKEGQKKSVKKIVFRIAKQKVQKAQGASKTSTPLAS